MSSYAWISRLKPGTEEIYDAAHRRMPAAVDAAIRGAGIARYAIFRSELTLVGVFDTDDLRRTMHALVNDPTLKRWRAEIDALLDHAADPQTGFQPIASTVWELPPDVRAPRHPAAAAPVEGPKLRPLPTRPISGFEDLRDKVVLITGASTGIGAAVAQAFGACGARVVVHFNRSEDAAREVVAAVETAGGTAVAMQGDITDPRVPAALVAATVRQFGGFDVLINNAGHVLTRTPIAEMSDERFHQIMDLNFTSLFAMCRAAIPVLRARGGGAIISTGSVAARIGGGPGAAIYGAAKAAVTNFSRGLAKELVADRIRVNVVAPGVIETPLHVQLSPPDAWARFLAGVPMGRAGLPEECAGAYLYLASERLSSYVTGQTIEVNGGQLMP